jgi:hypothetical protein
MLGTETILLQGPARRHTASVQMASSARSADHILIRESGKDREGLTSLFLPNGKMSPWEVRVDNVRRLVKSAASRCRQTSFPVKGQILCVVAAGGDGLSPAVGTRIARRLVKSAASRCRQTSFSVKGQISAFCRSRRGRAFPDWRCSGNAAAGMRRFSLRASLLSGQRSVSVFCRGRWGRAPPTASSRACGG